MGEYERNVLYRASLTGDFFFAPKVQVLSETVRCVVGRKYNVTDALQPYLLKRFRRKNRPSPPAVKETPAE